MGGGETLNIGLSHLDTFCLDRQLLLAPNTKALAEVVPDPAAAKEKLKLLWLPCGNTGFEHITPEARDTTC